MAKASGKTFVEIDLDAKKYVAGIAKVKIGSKKELTEMEKAWKGLGGKAELTFDKMRAEANRNYDKIKKSAFSTADDIVKAEKAKNEKIARINKQQFGEQKSWIDKAKKHWVAFSVVAIAAIMAIRVAVRKIITAMKDWINAASNLQEVTGKFNVVFEGQLGLAEKWSKELVDAYVMSTREAKEYLSSIQDLLVPMGMAADAAGAMSFEVVKLSADLGSFNNLPTAKVMADIQSALVGNFETMKKYGVVLNMTVVQEKALAMGLAKTKSELTAGLKAQAAYALMVEGSKAAIGDMARTSGNYANQLKQLHANIENFQAMLGEKLLPIVTTIIININKWIKANQEFITQGFETVIQGIVNVFKSWLPILRETVGYWVKFFKIADENRAATISTVDDITEKIKALDQVTARLVRTQKEINELIAGGIVPASAYTTMLAEIAKQIEANETLVGKYEKALKRLVKVKIAVTDAGLEEEIAMIKTRVALEKSIETHDELFSLIFLGLGRAAKKWEDFSDEAIVAALKSGRSFNNLYGMMFAGMDQAATEWEDSMEDMEKAAEIASRGMMERFKESARDIANSVKNTLGTVWSVVSNIWGKIKSMARMFTGAITFFITFPGDLKEAMERFTDSIADFPKIVDEFLAAVGTFVDNLPKIVITFIKSAGKFIDGLVKAIPKVITALIKELPKLVDTIIKGAEKFTAAILKKLPDIVAALIKQVPKLITSIMEKFIPALLDAVPKILEKILEGIPAIIKAFISGIPMVITALMKAIASLIPVLVKEIPKIVKALIMNIAKEVPKIIKAFLDGIPDIITALIKGVPAFITAIVKDIPVLVRAIIDSIPEIIAAFIDSIPAIAEALIEAIKDTAIPSKGRDILDPFDIFHKGGIVGQTQTASASVAPAVFASAPRAHRGLMAGEVPIIAKRGEGIFTPAQMRALGRQGQGGTDREPYIIKNNITIQLDGKVIYEGFYDATRSGKVTIHPKAAAGYLERVGIA